MRCPCAGCRRLSDDRARAEGFRGGIDEDERIVSASSLARHCRASRQGGRGVGGGRPAAGLSTVLRTSRRRRHRLGSSIVCCERHSGKRREYEGENQSHAGILKRTATPVKALARRVSPARKPHASWGSWVNPSERLAHPPGPGAGHESHSATGSRSSKGSPHLVGPRASCRTKCRTCATPLCRYVSSSRT